jgi:hypothetical protein
MNLSEFVQSVKKLNEFDVYPVSSCYSLSQLFGLTWDTGYQCVSRYINDGHNYLDEYEEVGSEIYLTPNGFALLMDYLPEELSTSEVAKAVRQQLKSL